MRKWILSFFVVACAQVATVESLSPDAGTSAPPGPQIVSVSPQPGAIAGSETFTIVFSEAMDEGALLDASGGSETVVLASGDQVEAVAAAIEHDTLSAYERSLLVPVQARIASDRATLSLQPASPLAPGSWWLLVSPRVKDAAGLKISSPARFAYTVAPPAPKPLLLWPLAGTDAPSNLAVVYAAAAAGSLSVLDASGAVLASGAASSQTALVLSRPLLAGESLVLALDGTPDASQTFTVSSCARAAAPSIGDVTIAGSANSVSIAATLDWPARVTAQVGLASDGVPCESGACTTAETQVFCAPAVCGPETFDCALSLDVQGLLPATSYALRLVAADDGGRSSASAVQPFSTIAPVPNLILSEVMVAPFSPEEEGEYVELFNAGPGVAVLDGLALQGPDGVARPLTATPPPTPVSLSPGDRALAVGAAFDVARYVAIPPATPVLRASTKSLLGRGLSDSAPQAFSLVQGSAVLAHFPAPRLTCASNESLQRDETQAASEDGTWSCGPVGGTPGAPP